MVVAACVLILIGIFVINKPKAGAPSNSNSNSGAKPSSHIEGQGKKDIKLVEYGDYQCPICFAYYPIAKQVATKYDNDIFFQFRNLPISQLHRNAVAGARAAEAASLQGKFWEMHDLLYENQDPNGQSGWVASSSALDNYFVGFAQQLGLNVDKFKQDFASSAVNDTIDADLTEFNKTGREIGTPTFFLDGKFIEYSKITDSTGRPDLTKFSKVIDDEIKSKNK